MIEPLAEPWLVQDVENGSVEAIPYSTGVNVPPAMQSEPVFTKLNDGWNAEPNAPSPCVEMRGRDLLLSFYLNPFAFPKFTNGDVGVLRFRECVSYRLGPTNDEGWYSGQCRYSSLAPKWGEFYEISGDESRRDLPTDWRRSFDDAQGCKHYLFYLRDETFECISKSWEPEAVPENALFSKAPR